MVLSLNARKSGIAQRVKQTVQQLTLVKCSKSYAFFFWKKKTQDECKRHNQHKTFFNIIRFCTCTRSSGWGHRTLGLSNQRRMPCHFANCACQTLYKTKAVKQRHKATHFIFYGIQRALGFQNIYLALSHTSYARFFFKNMLLWVGKVSTI